MTEEINISKAQFKQEVKLAYLYGTVSPHIVKRREKYFNVYWEQLVIRNKNSKKTLDAFAEIKKAFMIGRREDQSPENREIQFNKYWEERKKELRWKTTQRHYPTY